MILPAQRSWAVLLNLYTSLRRAKAPPIVDEWETLISFLFNSNLWISPCYSISLIKLWTTYLMCQLTSYNNLFWLTFSAVFFRGMKLLSLLENRCSVAHDLPVQKPKDPKLNNMQLSTIDFIKSLRSTQYRKQFKLQFTLKKYLIIHPIFELG